MTDEPTTEVRELVCVECEVTTAVDPVGWVAFRVDLDPGDEPELAFYCPTCAKREFSS
jgi:hypothetical protein